MWEKSLGLAYYLIMSSVSNKGDLQPHLDQWNIEHLDSRKSKKVDRLRSVELGSDECGDQGGETALPLGQCVL